MAKEKLRYIIKQFPKSSIQAGEGQPEGAFPFYTSSQELTLFYDKALYPAGTITMGTGGVACVNYSSVPFATSTDCWNICCFGLNTKFLYYWLFSSIKKIDDLYFWGMGLKHLQKDKIKNEIIEFPDLAEQKRIVNFLDYRFEQIDALISNCEKQIDELRNYKFSLIEEMINSGSCLEKIKFNSFVKNKKCQREGLPYFALENIESNTGKFVETSSEYSSNGAILCEEGDICFGKLRPYLNKYFYIQYKTTCSSEIAVFKEKNKTKYMYYLVQSPKFIQLCNAYSEGTKMPRINIEFIKNWKFNFPDEGEQKEIVKYLEGKIEKLEDLISLKKKIIDELLKLKTSIAYEYINSIKEVPNEYR